MDPPTGTSSPDAEPQLRKSTRSSLREAFESLHLTMQLRVIALTAVTSTLLLVLVIGAHWDTRFARSEALDLARSRTASMAERLQAAGGGALDDLQGYPEFMASTFRLQSGEVLQRYVRADLIAERGARAPEALGWTTRPRGAWHWLMGYLALEPIYVESPVELGPNLSGTVSVVVDHRWIWHQGLHGLWQWPVALLIGVDLVKPVDVLQAAYDDALGVTAAFNLNLLRHLNRLLGADFDVRDWRHVAFFDPRASRIEMHLEARRALTVRWRGGERRFAAGERMHTEDSYKWRRGDFEALLREAGFRDLRAWTDEAGWFAVMLAAG